MRRGAWWIFAAACVLGALSLFWVTRVVVELDRGNVEEAWANEHRISMQRALWRMDASVGPQIAEAAMLRPWPLSEQDDTLAEQLMANDMNGVVNAEAQTADAIYPQLYFNVDPEEGFASPNVQYEGQTANALNAPQQGLQNIQVLAQIEEVTSYQELDARLGKATQQRELQISQSAVPRQQRAQSKVGANLDNDVEFNLRARNFNRGQQLAEVQDAILEPADPRIPVPLWVGGGDERRLIVCERREKGGPLTGFVLDWESLRARLLADVEDLFSEADLIPVASTEGEEYALATLPVRLVAEPLERPPYRLSGPLRLPLVLAWSAGLLTMLAVGFTLRSSLAYGEKRQRFASSVTHELRTPLTTFRMYSDMLVKGMVPPERTPEYASTLQNEADRLSHLVENVLTYAQLEEGRSSLRREAITLGELLARTRGPLEGRAARAEASLALEVAADGARILRTDAEAVGQILFNLVDNACKYGLGRERRIAVNVSALAERIRFEIRDDGPGVPVASERAIFKPFERERDAADPQPGIGLGLALARGLAEDLGGTLELVREGGVGATFRLELPA